MITENGLVKVSWEKSSLSGADQCCPEVGWSGSNSSSVTLSDSAVYSPLLAKPEKRELLGNYYGSFTPPRVEIVVPIDEWRVWMHDLGTGLMIPLREAAGLAVKENVIYGARAITVSREGEQNLYKTLSYTLEEWHLFAAAAAEGAFRNPSHESTVPSRQIPALH